MKVLFVAETWPGSSSRGLREALSRQPQVYIEDIGVDLFVPRFHARILRAANRILFTTELASLKHSIVKACKDFQPDVIVFVKGWHFDGDFIRLLRENYAPVVNIFPDASPHVHGKRLRDAMNEYDLVISRNKHHPPLWKSVYGYDNNCVHVTHAYVAGMHERDEPACHQPYDLVMIANGREEYAAHIRELVKCMKGRSLSFLIGGDHWENLGLDEIPWIKFCGEKPGARYTEWLRKGKIVIAPTQTILYADGERQPGDEVTGRTFQCAAAYTFFIHRRTSEVKEYYDEATEVPLYDNGIELAEKVESFLRDKSARDRMAAAAHARAVPAYSFDKRAEEIVVWLKRVAKREIDCQNAGRHASTKTCA